jgi:hypothetical protein
MLLYSLAMLWHPYPMTTDTSLDSHKSFQSPQCCGSLSPHNASMNQGLKSYLTFQSLSWENKVIRLLGLFLHGIFQVVVWTMQVESNWPHFMDLLSMKTYISFRNDHSIGMCSFCFLTGRQNANRKHVTIESCFSCWHEELSQDTVESALQPLPNELGRLAESW